MKLINYLPTTLKHKIIEKKVDKMVNEILKDEPRMRGFCHRYWATKKKILREHYGIIWYTPAERNPDIRYD